MLPRRTTAGFLRNCYKTVLAQPYYINFLLKMQALFRVSEEGTGLFLPLFRAKDEGNLMKIRA